MPDAVKIRRLPFTRWRAVPGIGVALLTLYLASLAHADPLDTKEAVKEAKNFQTEGDFSAQFWMTDDDGIFTSWERSSALRNLKQLPLVRPNTFQVKRNKPVYMALFIANPEVRSIQISNRQFYTYSDVTYDFYIFNPRGELMTISKQQAAWRGEPPSPKLVHLARDRSSVTFEAIDPPGEYTVIVIVHDNIRRADNKPVDIRLMRKLELEE